MKTNTSTSQKIGWVIFTIGAIYMFGLGWLHSWWLVLAGSAVEVFSHNFTAGVAAASLFRRPVPVRERQKGGQSVLA